MECLEFVFRATSFNSISQNKCGGRKQAVATENGDVDKDCADRTVADR